MKTLLFKMRGYLAEENRFGRRVWDELPASMPLTAAYLDNAGFDIDLRDQPFYVDEAFEGYDVAAQWISVADGLYEGLDYLRVAKQRGLKTVMLLFDDWEGLSRQIFDDYPFVDYAVRRWDVETSLRNLLQHLRDGTALDLKGLINRIDGKAVDHGESIAHPERLSHLRSSRKWIEHLDPAGYQEFAIRIGSGCPFKCTFCHIGSRPNRYRNVEDVLDELEALPRGVFVRVLSADMLADPKWTGEFAQGIINRGIDVRWETDSRFTWLQDMDFLRLLKRSGCAELAMGLESYHPALLGAYKKGYRHELIDSGIANLLKAGIAPGLNMMIGHPRENEETLLTTETFLKRVNPNEVKLIGIQFLRPLPGTAIFKEAVAQGLLDASYSYRDFYASRDEPMLATNTLSKDEIRVWRDRLVTAYCS